MKLLLLIVLAGFAVSFPVDGQSIETLVCIRHGEKPHGGLGQLTCRGLNRALALPNVLLGKYGRPQFVFAPNPTPRLESTGTYYYIRPLMTIEPTAIRCGLPVNTQFGSEQIAGLQNELQKPEYQSATVFIAWEHLLLDRFVKDILKTNGGNPEQVPPWPANDYDSIFIVKIIRSATGQSVAFTIDHEGLDGLSENCP